MALAFTIKQRNRTGNQKRHTVDIAFDSSYPTGGEAATAAKFGLTVVNDVVFPEPSGGYIFQYDRTNSKIIVYNAGGAGAHTHDLTFIGGITATEAVAIEGGNKLGKNAATDRTIAGANSATLGGVVASTATVAAMTEVANTTDLSALTAVRCVASGR